MREVKQPPLTRTWRHAIEDSLDRLVSLIAPRAAAERMAFRRQWRSVEVRMSAFDTLSSRTYDGATQDKTRTSSWLGSKLSPNSALEGDLDTLRTRSLELYRNDPVGGAIDGRANLVVSYGFTPQARIKERAGLVTAAQADQWNGELEDVYTQTAPAIDKSGQRSLWQLLRLIERHHGAYGESFTVLSDRNDPTRPIPLTLEVVDPERVETPPDKVSNPLIRLGIEHDAAGLIVAYWIRDKHPGDTLDLNLKYTRYAADRVLHVFEPLFAAQARGLPWLVRTLNRLKDAKDLDEASIIAAQVQACFAAFVTSPNGGGRAADAALSGTQDGSRYEEIRPGMIRYLDQGEAVNFSSPAGAGNNFGPFQEWNYRRAAAGLNYPYEMLTKNWAGLSFAAGRLSLAEARLFVQSQQQLLIEAWLGQIWQRLVYESVLVGACSIPIRTYEQAPWWFHQHTWTPPAWPFALTPGEEIEAKIKSVNNNLIPKAKVVAEFGGDWEDVAAQRRDERATERTYEIDPATAEVPITQPPADPTPQKKEQLAQ